MPGDNTGKNPAQSTENQPEETPQAYPVRVTLKKNTCTYNGRAQKPGVTVIDSNGQIMDPSAYTVSCRNHKNVGRAIVTVSFANQAYGTLSAEFTILPKTTSVAKLKSSGGKISVSWKKQKKQTSGYEIRYAATANGKGAKTVTVRNNAKSSAVIRNVKAGKKYYVAVRTYRIVKINGKSQKLYSGWSKAKTVKTRKK